MRLQLGLLRRGGSSVCFDPIRERLSDAISGSGKSPGEGNGNPFQYSCLEKAHGQRSLAGYSLWGHERVGCDLASKQYSFV